MSVLRGAACALFFWTVVGSVQAGLIEPFISEIHYDNEGVDRGEFVAVTAPAGTDLSGWQLVLYNGSNGAPYGVRELDGRVTADQDWVEFAWSFGSLQNGDDAVALVSAAQAVVDFIAYEGTFEALEGVARGESPWLLPVAEGADTGVGWSLQRTGRLDALHWAAADATPGRLNAGLFLPAVGSGPIERTGRDVTAPAVYLLWPLAVLAWVLVARRSARAGADRRAEIVCPT